MRDAREDRDKLIEVGLAVGVRQGYETTTLADIAAAANIPEEALAAQFATPEDIVMAPVRAMLTGVAAALADIDADIPPIVALRSAHSRMLHDVIEGVGPVSFGRMQALGCVVMKSPHLQQRISAYRKEVLTAMLAEHLHVQLPNTVITSAVLTWSAVVSAAYAAAPDRWGKFDALDDREHPQRMQDRLDKAFSVITGR